MQRLLLVDGHSNLYRAFYAIRAPLSAPDGTPTGATYGFLRMQHKLLRDFAPSHVAVAFDMGRETFRTRLDERYKAQREPMPDELRVQVPLTQEALGLLGLDVLTMEDFEADDIIGTLAAQAAAAGIQVVIASQDKDLMQLVHDPWVAMYHTRLERLLDAKGVEEVFGVPPNQVVEVLTLMGDASDNIPGCPGIGEKTAKELIRRWDTVEEAYAHLDEVTPSRAQRALQEHRAEVELAARLVRINTELKLPVGIAALARHEPRTAELATLYRRLGFTSMLAELERTAVPSPAATSSGATERAVTLDQATALLGRGSVLAVSAEGNTLALATADEVVVLDAGPEVWGQELAAHGGGAWTYDAKRMTSLMRDAGHTPVAPLNDALLAAYLLAPGENVDLAALCRRFSLDAPAKDAGAAEVARVVARTAPLLQKQLETENLEKLYREIELPLVPILESMERHGVKLDVPALEDLSRRLERSLAELEGEIHGEAGGPFNINSPAQLAEVLFERRGLPVLRRTQKTKAPSTDAEVLQELANQGHRLPALLLEYREQSKLKSTYVDALPRQLGADGRIHTRFNQAVASTGRLSSSDPNLQNIPIRSETGRLVRRAFIPDPGQVLLAADYSQIELRVLAHLSEDPALERAFANNEDIHQATASLVFGVMPALVTPDQRRAAKTINFGLIYGMGAYALARELGVSNAEAKRFIDTYFERMPRVQSFLTETKKRARRDGKVLTMFGRARWIAGLDSPNAQLRAAAERMAINAPVQGSAADLMKLAMINLDRAIEKKKLPARLLLQVHDELILEVDAGAVERVRTVVRKTMEGVAELRVPLAVDIGVGPSWAEAKG